MSDSILEELIAQRNKRKEETVKSESDVMQVLKKRASPVSAVPPPLPVQNIMTGASANLASDISGSITVIDNGSVSAGSLNQQLYPAQKVNFAPPVYQKGNIVNVSPNAYGDSVKLAKEKIRSQDHVKFNAISKVAAGEILVVPGSYDKIETILDASGIPYSDFNTQDLKGAKIVFVNCSGSYSFDMKALAKFVAAGGYAVTTDWALNKVVAKQFGCLKHVGKNTSNDCVDVSVPDPDNYIVRDAFPFGTQPSWWLETSSYPIGITSDDVKVLVRSDELRQKYESDIIGATFPYGSGRVFHFISHFKLQQTKNYLNEDKQLGEAFIKDILKLNPQAVGRLGIDKDHSYAALETAYTSSMLIYNIIAAKKTGAGI